MEKHLLVSTCPPIFHLRFTLVIYAGLSIDQSQGDVIPSYTAQHPESHTPPTYYRIRMPYDLFASAVFASFWTTLTALLSSPIYHYSSLKTGIFALIGVAPLIFIPPYSRLIIDRFVPNLSDALGLVYAIIGVIVGSYTGSRTIAGIVIEAMCIDFGIPTASIAYRAAIYAADPNARNRTNVAYTVSSFAGQLMGTSVGNHLYAVGGWELSGEANIGFVKKIASVAIAYVTLRRDLRSIITTVFPFNGSRILKRKHAASSRPPERNPMARIAHGKPIFGAR